MLTPTGLQGANLTVLAFVIFLVIGSSTDAQPVYSKQSQPTAPPVEIYDIAHGLHHGDHALYYAFDGDVGEAWHITQAKYSRADIGTRTDLAVLVTALRCGLNQGAWYESESATNCARLLGLPSPASPNQPLPFSLEVSYKLYSVLI